MTRHQLNEASPAEVINTLTPDTVKRRLRLVLDDREEALATLLEQSSNPKGLLCLLDGPPQRLCPGATQAGRTGRSDGHTTARCQLLASGGGSVPMRRYLHPRQHQHRPVARHVLRDVACGPTDRRQHGGCDSAAVAAHVEAPQVGARSVYAHAPARATVRYLRTAPSFPGGIQLAAQERLRRLALPAPAAESEAEPGTN
jgi:hypothetical protein